MRDAYSRPLTDREKKSLDQNPSYFAEIYIMRADGSGQKRLTSVAGYDGGPSSRTTARASSGADSTSRG
jgi:hypothetical protein